MIYNFNLGIGWASSGVEYAQSYRAVMLRNIGADARFVFTDMIASENIEHLTKNITQRSTPTAGTEKPEGLYSPERTTTMRSISWTRSRNGFTGWKSSQGDT